MTLTGAPDLRPDRCLIVGEVGLSHDGSLGLAHAFIDEIARGGADAVKFQTHIATAESTPAEPFRVQFSRQDATRYEYWQRIEFSEAQWKGLADHARDKGLIFLSSPFSVEAVELLDPLGVPAWKVGSGEVGNVQLLDRMIRTGKPVIGVGGIRTPEDVEQYLDAGAVLVAVGTAALADPRVPERLAASWSRQWRS